MTRPARDRRCGAVDLPAVAQQARRSSDLARAGLDGGNSAALALLAAACYDALRLAGLLAQWRPASGRRSGSILAAVDLLDQSARRGLVVAAGGGLPGEGAEIAAGLQYAISLVVADLLS